MGVEDGQDLEIAAAVDADLRVTSDLHPDATGASVLVADLDITARALASDLSIDPQMLG